MTQFTCSQMGEHWYLVADANKSAIEYAVFMLVDARNAKTPSYKHMELKFTEEASDEILGNINISLLLDIYAFVFDKVLEITHQLNDIELCKIYSDDAVTRMVYQKFAEKLGKNYDVKSYGNWIEILKNRENS